MEIEALQTELRLFALERNWEQFHTVKNLVLALVGEVGELAAVIQWLDFVDAQKFKSDPVLKRAFEDEISDVLIYLLRLADISEINLPEVAKRKIKENSERYTIEKSFSNSKKQNR